MEQDDLQGRFEEAAALFEQALDGARRTLGEAHDMTGQILGGFGKSLIDLDRFAEAEAYLIEAHMIISAALGSEHMYAVKQIDSLVHLYDAWGEPEKAAEWRAKLPDGAEMDEEAVDGG